LDLTQPSIATRDEFLPGCCVPFVEILHPKALWHRWSIFKTLIDDELRKDRIASQMALGTQMESLRVDLPDHETQVQGAFAERLDLLATDSAQITLIAFGHGL
jgi:hypothetical protein